ncbi:hypothetical protein PSECIP111854_01046 [Pseudoalteromonas sp. CIP111854]|uniref:Transcriptional regulator n=1 Tax=Pseudoalteromonas holothuriae TaxID=2963714 RepID=A0A9W4QTZ7_9GAMM|nr:FMN-binding negative transcriptional regulator [Pseudoalteromonas sp. CIP111854]CAH9052807.1 hypothetical protein PSECIP111854_01046 [Pseudoalteromonas sp. CIP111854]
MYPPTHFQDNTLERILSLAQQAPLATILFQADDGSLNHAIYAPLVFDATQQIFIGHVAANNPLIAAKNSQVKILFHGPNGYLSPNHSEHLVVPTWLYANAQLTGLIEVVRDTHTKLSMINQITNHFEQAFEHPWPVNALCDAKRDTMLKHIEFFTISIQHWQGDFKLSQNKPQHVKTQIKQNLAKQGDMALAKMVD